MKKTLFLLVLLALAVPLQAQEYAKSAPAPAKVASAMFSRGSSTPTPVRTTFDGSTIGALPTTMPVPDATPTRMTAGARVYIVPNQGFEDSLSAAITKKKVPVVVVEKESTAQFKVESTIDFKKGSTARAIFLGPANDGAATTASVRVVDEASGAIVFAYNVRKYGSTNTQSTSEAFAKHLKGFIEHGGS